MDKLRSLSKDLILITHWLQIAVPYRKDSMISLPTEILCVVDRSPWVQNMEPFNAGKL